GTHARHVGHDSIGPDFAARRTHARAVETYHRLDHETREVYRGFAEGLNHYIRLHPEVFPAWVEPDLTGVDAHGRDIQSWSRGDAAAFVRREEGRLASGSRAGAEAESGFEAEAGFDPEVDGSNAWALHGSRTVSGNTILLRNPHLSWNAGYYEAHVRVPGVLEFYGDFRIGGAFGIIGGFNRHLGWATTNNSPRYSQVYALERHPELDDHALLDGAPLPIDERTVSVDYRTADGGPGIETETTLWTTYGPVIHETAERIYILKDPRDGEFRRGEQFLRMMMATSLDEWLDVMQMRAHPSSNFTYADADGNIALYYNARIPDLPHPSTGDTAAVALSSDDMWSELAPWDDLPLYINPPGGYVQQANDTPHYINLNVTLGADTVAANLPEPRLRLRSQLSFDLIHGDDRLTLDDVVERKHSPRILAAERMLDDLLEIIDRSAAPVELAEARDVLAGWDRTASVESRGGVLFARWFDAYQERVDSAYAIPWTQERPTDTPSGVAASGPAVSALYQVLGDMRASGTPLDIAWGEVHRVIRGDVDVPVSGCEGGMGCFRTLSFEETPDGRQAANRGDGWVFVVELGGAEPVGRTVLAYGQSNQEDSPHFDDQAAMFAQGEMKVIRWTEADIEAGAIRRYQPGQDSR
ncbi:MAG: penicillin acylase family protein, partial [Gemmatimonadetes bacterium]|nr:penicillin acylase family protein [Gemmatimonadota bacterium]